MSLSGSISFGNQLLSHVECLFANQVKNYEPGATSQPFHVILHICLSENHSHFLLQLDPIKISSVYMDQIGCV